LSVTTITKKFSVDNVLTNPTTIKLSDPDGNYGVKRDDTGAVVVADGTSMSKISTGQYSYTLTDEAYNLTYSYYVEIVYGGETYYFEGTVDGTVSPGITGGMTLDEMSSLLSIYLNDTKEKDFPKKVKVLLLNSAQDRVLSLLNRSVVTDLDSSALAQALDSDGKFYLITLDYTLYNGIHGIDGIKLTGGDFSDLITFKEYKWLLDHDRTFQTDDPKHYYRGNYVYVNPHADQTIDIYYRKTPTQMAFGSPNTDCELNGCLHSIIVGLACQDYIDLYPAAARAYQGAILAITEMNRNNITSSSDSKIFNQISSDSNVNFLNK